MAVDWWARAFGLIGIAISLAGLTISYAQYRHSRPRMKIAAKTSLVTGLADSRREMRSCVVVTVANDGGADVRINSVEVSGPGFDGPLIQGPDTPLVLSAHGGRSTWLFDYQAMRNQLGELVRTEMRENVPVQVQAVIRTGSKILAPGGATVYVNPPGVSTYHPGSISLRRRYREWRRTWSRAVPSLEFMTRVTLASLEERQSVLTISNRYRRTSDPCALQLTVKYADGARSPVATQRELDVPRIRGRRSIKFLVPFVDDSGASPGDEFDWMLRTHAGFGAQGAGATPLSEIPALRAHFDEVSAQQSSSEPDDA